MAIFNSYVTNYQKVTLVQSRPLRLLPLLRWLLWWLPAAVPIQDRLQRGVAGDAPGFPVQSEGVDASDDGGLVCVFFVRAGGENDFIWLSSFMFIYVHVLVI